MENQYQIEMNDLRKELIRSNRACDELRNIEQICQNKDLFISFYVNTLKNSLKNEEARIKNKIFLDDIEDFIRKLSREKLEISPIQFKPPPAHMQ